MHSRLISSRRGVSQMWLLAGLAGAGILAYFFLASQGMEDGYSSSPAGYGSLIDGASSTAVPYGQAYADPYGQGYYDPYASQSLDPYGSSQVSYDPGLDLAFATTATDALGADPFGASDSVGLPALPDAIPLGPESSEAPLVDRETFRQRFIERFDTDGDGSLSEQERSAAQEGMGPMLESIERMKRSVLERFDADGDGSLSDAERENARAARRDMHDDPELKRLFQAFRSAHSRVRELSAAGSDPQTLLQAQQELALARAALKDRKERMMNP